MPFAMKDGCRLYWREDGRREQPALLLLNSLGTDLSVWDRVVPLLSERYRIIRMDTRGHGASDAPAGPYNLDLLAADASAVLDAAGADTVSVCGISLGGMIAMSLALKAPSRIGALILACTSAKMDRATWQTRHDTVLAQGMGAITPMALQRFFSDPFRRTHPEILETIGAGLLTTSPAGYAGCCAAIRDMDLLPALPAIRGPVLVITASRDVSTPLDGHGDKILGAIPQARHLPLDAAHLACLETPSAFATALCAFLDEMAQDSGLRAAKDALYEAGLKTRRKVLGDDWVDRTLKSRTAFNAEFQELITRYAWNEVWSRPGLDHRTRRLVVLAITVSLGRWEEFRLHLKSGLEQGGFTLDEVKEVLMQTAIYAGVPAANTAFHEAAELIRQLDENTES